ncbi:MAG: hypothetical protein IJH63_03085 [Methanobrevibacter sp.]|nr:hypothetical protein [Methanobrevibacter sp.]
MSFFEVNKIPLKIVMNDGITTTMGTSIKETTLLYDNLNNNAPTYYFNSGDSGVSFEISVVIKQEYYFNNHQIIEYLNQYDKWGTRVPVVTNAIDIPNGIYTMRIKSKKQSYHNLSIWKLYFKQYYEDDMSFEVYDSKTSSLSSIDQMLLRCRVPVDSTSPTDVIKAVQLKLQERGCWSDTVWHFNGTQWVVVLDDEGESNRIPNGKWDEQMQGDIASFQNLNGLINKNGICDEETLKAMLGNTYEGNGFYHQGVY